MRKKPWLPVLFLGLIHLCSILSQAAPISDSAYCDSLLDCHENYVRNDCHELVKEEKASEFLQDCSTAELIKEKSQSLLDVLKNCTVGVSEDIRQTVQFISSLPGAAANSLGRHREANLKAQGICKNKLGYSFDNAVKSKYMDHKGQDLYQWNQCVWEQSMQILNYPKPPIPNIDEAIQSLRELDQKRLCFKASAQSFFVCPVLAGGIFGMTGSFLRKKMVNLYRAKIRSPKVQETIDQYQKSLSPGEKYQRSFQSTVDQVDFLENPKVAALAKSGDIDPKQMAIGLIESDLGKDPKYWNKIFEVNEGTENLIEALQGKGNTPAARALLQLYKSEGRGDRPFLNPKISPSEIRKVLKESPTMQFYLHEIPGMLTPIRELNAGKITVKEFEDRIRTIQFHNGPHEGFYRMAGEVFVPDALRKLDDGKYLDFLKGSQFEGKDGKAIYPTPMGLSGYISTLGDRISQGSRGGRTKIFFDRAGTKMQTHPRSPLSEIVSGNKPVGMEYVHEVLFFVGEGTLKQMDALIKLGPQGNIPEGTKKLAVQFGQDRRRRLQKIDEFVQKNVEVQKEGDAFKKFILQYEDSMGQPVKVTITADTPIDKTLQKIDDFLASEERLNGDPFRDLPKDKSPQKAALRAGAAGAAVGFRQSTKLPDCSNHIRPDWKKNFGIDSLAP